MIPGLAYPLAERKSDIKTVLEILDQFPARIDPIQVITQTFFLHSADFYQ